MKTIVVLLFLLSAGICNAQAVPGADTAVTNRLDRLIKLGMEGNKALNTLETEADSLKKNLLPARAAIVSGPVAGPGVFQWTLILLPVLLFALYGLYFLRWLKRDGYKIADALSVDMPDAQVLELQQTAGALALARGAAAGGGAGGGSPAAAPTPPPDPVLKRSSSRLIAFLSGLSAIIIALCIVSYYMYFAINDMPIPEFEALWPILASLGIGVVPYASKVIGEKK